MRHQRYSVEMESVDPQHVLALTAIVQQMINESGDPVGFDAQAWTTRWIQRPLPALGGALPAEYMVTPEGRELVERVVWSMQAGAYQ